MYLIINGKAYDEKEINVVKPIVENMRISYENELHYIGDSVDLNIDIQTNIPYEGFKPIVRSLNTKAVEVYDDNKLRGRGTGYCVVKITAGNKSKKLVFIIKKDKYFKNDYVDISDDKSNEYILPYSNSKFLSDEDIKYLSKSKLSLARNEIFARWGYVFKEEPYKSYFNNKSWYHPDSTYVENIYNLNQYELKNLKLIKKYEIRQV